MKMSDFDERDERIRQADERRAALGGARQVRASLFPCEIVALGASQYPVERMMGLQSGFYRLLVLLDGFRWPGMRHQPEDRDVETPIASLPGHQALLRASR